MEKKLEFEGFGDDVESLRAFGKEVTIRLCQTLLEQGTPGLHFYCMNRTNPTKAIWQELGLTK